MYKMAGHPLLPLTPVDEAAREAEERGQKEGDDSQERWEEGE
jgi:hypothetical protein